MRGKRFCNTALICALLCASACASAWDIAELMQRLSSHRNGRATFTETTYLAVLDQPVESSGELAFEAPDRLQKSTLKPRRETLLLQGDTLTIERKNRKQQLRMTEYPQLAVFIDSIRGTLMGDRAALERTYELALSGDAQAWSLELTPKSATAKTIRAVKISGSGDRVQIIEIAQADGDRSVMRIQNDIFDTDTVP